MLWKGPKDSVCIWRRLQMNWSWEARLDPYFFLLSSFRRSALFNFSLDRGLRRLPEANTD